jgi:hypothetical protein
MHTTSVFSGVGLCAPAAGAYANVDARKKISKMVNIAFIFICPFAPFWWDSLARLQTN